jgi:hypothetical protein
MTMDLTELQRQLDALTQQEHQDESTLRSVAADLTRQAYMLEAVHQLLDIIEPRKMQLAERIASIVPRQSAVAQRQTPPPLPRADDLDDFVGRVAARYSPYTNVEPHPSDPYDIAGWASARRAAE